MGGVPSGPSPCAPGSRGGKPGRAAGVTPRAMLGLGPGRPYPLPLVEVGLSCPRSWSHCVTCCDYPVSVGVCGRRWRSLPLREAGQLRWQGSVVLIRCPSLSSAPAVRDRPRGLGGLGAGLATAPWAGLSGAHHPWESNRQRGSFDRETPRNLGSWGEEETPFIGAWAGR